MTDFWELGVETYLAMDRSLFLNPQYVIGEPGKWEASADFLGLDFRDNRAWMIEVTKAPGKGLLKKFSDFKAEYETRIRSQLTEDKVIDREKDASEWRIGLWIFAPEKFRSRLETLATSHEVAEFLFTPLADVIADDAWDKRYRVPHKL
jgi:hypothetical protein